MSATSPPITGLRDAFGRPYVPAVSPRLKIVLAAIFAAVAVLGATGAYLSSIRLLDMFSGRTYTTPFKYWMLIIHVAVGVMMTLPFLMFGALHWLSARTRPNRYAVKLGLLMFSAGILVCLTGFALIRLDGLPQLRTETVSHTVVLVLHVLVPLVAVGLYVLHRRAGPDIQWKWGGWWGAGVALFCIAMLVMHSQDPRAWFKQGSVEGEAYYRPSEALTSDGNFIAPEKLMMDEYCMKCHADIYRDHLHSAHKFSSFSNPAYLFSVRETRKVGMERDGHVKASRWCAGCHDPVPFFGGVFEDPRTDPKFDVVHDQVRLDRYLEVEDVIAGKKHAAESAVSSAGISCVVCHGVTHINSPIGNGAYTIEEPAHYPFAYSNNSILQWINNQVVKAEPSFHKKTFLKPFHKTAEFCSLCHKVGLPVELNHYKEFLRGQNHYDTYLLSGVSGHSARAFYYPPQAKNNCAACHMPTKKSRDFGAKDFDKNGTLTVHNHRFPAANTGLFDLLRQDPFHRDMAAGFGETIQLHDEFLRGVDPAGKKIRVDLFGIKEGGTIDGKLTVLRPELPALHPGRTYLVEVVVRTLLIGHPLTQGTVDSNEIWVDFQVTAGGQTIARNGALANPDDSGEVDRWAHYLNVHLLDRHGNRINRRNPQDIFTPLYDHQIPPGAAGVVHYQLDVPRDITGPIELKVRVRYRKFDDEYLRLVYNGTPPKTLICDICSDQVTLPVAGVAEKVSDQTSPIQPVWQRWNDYGIGCYLEGGAGAKKGELKQALEAFQHLASSGDKDATAHGWLNAARVLFDEGRLEDAVDALNKAGDAGAPWWTVAWFKGVVAAENATRPQDFDAAIAHLERIIDPKNQPTDRGFDFRRDYIVLAKLGNTLFKRSQLEEDSSEETRYLERALAAYQQVLAIDPEDLDAHYGLYQCLNRLGREANLTGDTPQSDFTSTAAALINRGASREGRIQAAAALARGVSDFCREPLADGKTPARLHPKLPTLRRLLAELQPAFHRETDSEVRTSMAAALAQVHRELHAIYKPDEIARSKTVAEYRRKNPAANHAAEAIVIYPTTERQRRAIIDKNLPLRKD